MNPRRSEITVGWALQVLTEGLLTQVITRRERHWVWQVEGQGEPEVLGASFSSALYRLGEIHRIEDLQRRLDRDLQEARSAMGAEVEQERRKALADLVDSLMSQMGRRELRGELAREDVLDRPVLRALKVELEKPSLWAARPVSTDERLFDRLNFEGR